MHSPVRPQVSPKVGWPWEQPLKAGRPLSLHHRYGEMPRQGFEPQLGSWTTWASSRTWLCIQSPLWSVSDLYVSEPQSRPLNQNIT